MNNFYFLSWKQKPESSSAFAPDKTMLGFELIPELDGKRSLPFDFNLKKIKEKKNGIEISDDLSGLKIIWNDYLANSLAWPLMSQKLRTVIDENLTGNEKIDWLSCKIKTIKEERIYYILRFNKLLDVLDLNKTMFVSGTDSIIKPVFSLNKVQRFGIFMAATPGEAELWRITSGIYVSETLKKAIQKEALTNIDFTKVPVA